METFKYDAPNHRVEAISSGGGDSLYFYGPNGKLLATFGITLVPGVSYFTYSGTDWVYLGGMLVGTTTAYAGGQRSSIVDRLGTGHPGYA